MAKSTKKKKKTSSGILSSTPKKIVLGITILLTIIYIFIVGNNTGFIGEFIKGGSFKYIGVGSYILPILIILNCILYLSGIKSSKLRNIFVFAYVLFIYSLILIDLNINIGDDLSARIKNAEILSNQFLGSGIIGASIAITLLNSIGKLGIYLSFIIVVFFAGIYILDISISELFQDLKESLKKISAFIKRNINKAKQKKNY